MTTMSMRYDPSPSLDDDDDDELNDSPYDQIHPRPHLETEEIESEGGSGSPQGKSKAVFDEILAKYQKGKPTEIVEEEYEAEPSFRQHKQDQGRLDELRENQRESNFGTQLARAGAHFARGPLTPLSAEGDLRAQERENRVPLESEEKDQSRRSKIMESIQNRKTREAIADKMAESRKQVGLGKRQLADETRAAKAERDVEKGQLKFEQQKDKYAKAMVKDLEPQIQKGNTAFGIAARNLQSIENVQALLDGNLDPNQLDQRQVFELVKGLDRVVSGGNPTVSGSEHLNIDTARGRLASWQEFITNKRKGAQAGDFVKNIADSLQRERAQAEKKIASAQKSLQLGHRWLKENAPDVYEEILEQVGAKPSSSAGMSSIEASGGQSPSVRVKAPNGSIKLIPESDLEAAIQAGGEVLK